MFNLKKAQISDTLSWIVATIIIILILSVPILLTKLGAINPKKISFERVQDPIATKSISGYLLQNYGAVIEKEIAQEKVSISNLDNSISPFLVSLNRSKAEGWNMVINSENKEVYRKSTYSLVSFDSEHFENFFYFYKSGKEVMLKFWMEGQMYV
jgi:hypothetical protein